MLAEINHQTASEMTLVGGYEETPAYLEDLHALAREVETAIAAIASNALPLLQESIARQEMLCTLLLARSNRTRGELCFQGAMAWAEFEQEVEALGTTMRTYNTLLTRCGKTNALLISLCKSYTGAYGAVQALSSGRALSCEV